jgi:light-regulated signal transduction histidine kinase (bacteriophytochrome)
MTDAPADDKWPRLLSLSVHELRTPISVVAGYIHMVLKDPTATFDERHRRWLEEAQKSCARLTKIADDMSDLSKIETGKTPLKRAPLDLHPLLAEVVAAVADTPDGSDPDRIVEVELTTDPGSALILGDAPRLKTALTSLLLGIRREVATNDRLLVRARLGTYQGKPASWIAIAEADHIERLAAASPESLVTFNEWRGGSGLTLPFARRIIDGHDGAIWSPFYRPADDSTKLPAQGTKAGAVVVLPHA